MSHQSNLEDLQEPITSASPEIRLIIEKILKLEKNKLYTKKNKHINDDILRIIKENID
jgi:hypothetical protein